MTEIGPLEWIKLAIYYAGYLYFVAAPATLWVLFNSGKLSRFIAAGFFVVITVLAYARFIEPRILLTATHDVALDGCFESAGAARIAVFSDTHNGLFGNAMPIERVARRIEAERADFVLIAGDFTYYLPPDQFDATFSALGEISAPVFAVLGNHDIGLPGPDLSAPLLHALPKHGVSIIGNRALKLSSKRFSLELVGLSDLWGGRQDLSLLKTRPATPRIVLTHNPATIEEVKSDSNLDLLIGGHTHGGQVQLPVLTCLLTGVCGDAAYGLRNVNHAPTFTTSGTGMVGLPIRFRAPPRIDILNIDYQACSL